MSLEVTKNIIEMEVSTQDMCLESAVTSIEFCVKEEVVMEFSDKPMGPQGPQGISGHKLSNVVPYYDTFTYRVGECYEDPLNGLVHRYTTAGAKAGSSPWTITKPTTILELEALTYV